MVLPYLFCCTSRKLIQMNTLNRPKVLRLSTDFPDSPLHQPATRIKSMMESRILSIPTRSIAILQHHVAICHHYPFHPPSSNPVSVRARTGSQTQATFTSTSAETW